MSDYDEFMRIASADDVARAAAAVAPATAAAMAADGGLVQGSRSLAPDAAGPFGGAPRRGSGGYAEETVTFLRRNVAASLAGGMIAASGRPHTAEEAVAVLEDVMATLHPPEPESGV